jgi:hypothetical protein
MLQKHGKPTAHLPELVLNNFNTRLGHNVGRLFATLFPKMAEFHGRRVVTFHNQRDYIFFRHHRYIFSDSGKKVRMQELGPRFTLKLQWLQHGTFDTEQGEYEWKHRVRHAPHLLYSRVTHARTEGTGYQQEAVLLVKQIQTLFDKVPMSQCDRSSTRAVNKMKIENVVYRQQHM